MARYSHDVAPARIQFEGQGRLACRGRCTADAVGAVESLQETMQELSGKTITLDTSGVEALDTTGACLLRRIQSRLPAAGLGVGFAGLQSRHRALLRELESHDLRAMIMLRRRRVGAGAVRRCAR